MRLVEIVERVEELLLGPFLAGDELDVVDQEQVDVAVLGAELRGSVVADGVDELVGEALGGEVEKTQCWIQTGDLVTDGVEEMGLAETDAAVDEQRVVGLGRELGDRLAGRLRELVGVADDEGVERVAGRESRWRGPDERRRGADVARRGLGCRAPISNERCGVAARGPGARRARATPGDCARASRELYCSEPRCGDGRRRGRPDDTVRSQDSRGHRGDWPKTAARAGPKKSQAFQHLERQRPVTHKVIHRCG